MAGPAGDPELRDPTALHRALRADSGLSAEASDAGEADGWVAAWTPRCWFAPSFSGFWTRPAPGGKGEGVRGWLMAAPQGIRGVNEWAVNVNEPCQNLEPESLCSPHH